jgi:hypothetical protein
MKFKQFIQNQYMKTNFLIIYRHTIFSSSFLPKWMDLSLRRVDNTSEYKTIELINMERSLTLQTCWRFLTYFFATTPYTVSSYQWSFLSIKRFVELTNPKNKSRLFMNDHFYQKNILMRVRMLISSVMEITPRLFIGWWLLLWGAKVIQSDINLKMEWFFIIDGFIEPPFFRRNLSFDTINLQGLPSNFNRNMLRESPLLWLW